MAGPAPGCPEIHHYRELVAALYYICLKVHVLWVLLGANFRIVTKEKG
jgi:hypothetical protein